MGHYLGLITFDKNEYDVKNRARAINHVETFLLDEGFCHQSFFASGICDYFTVSQSWCATKILQAEHGTKEFDTHFFDMDIIKQNRTQHDMQALIYLSEFYKKYKKTPQYIPVAGYLDGDCCASIVTRNIYENLLVKYLGIDRDDEEFWDLDFECVDESFIDRKWIVAIDYHI